MKHIATLTLFFFSVLTLVAQEDSLIPTKARQDYLVTDFGAKGDGVTLNSRAIQAAIDTVHARGGGRVIVPAGQFVTGTLYLKTGVDLHLDSGAVLLGSLNPFDYEKDPVVRWTSLLFAVDQKNIAVTGKGTLDGRGWEVANRMVQYIHLGLVKDPLKYDRPGGENRPELIHMLRCENVTISDITLRDPASWCQQYDQCRTLVLMHVTVDAKCYWNNDGLDVVDCKDVLIRHCHIDAADDAYCFKSHSRNGLSENVTVEHCFGRSSANGIKFGTVTRGKFRNFRFHDITIRDTYRSAITIASVDGSQIEDITFDNIHAYHTGNPIFLRLSHRNAQADQRPYLRHVVISNSTFEVPYDKPDAGYSYEGPVEDQPRNISPASIVGCPDQHISGVLLDNVEFTFPGRSDTAYAYFPATPAAIAALPEREKQYPEFSMWKELPAWGLFVRHADSIILQNVRFTVKGPDYRPALVTDDVNLFGLKQVDIQIPDSKKLLGLVAQNTILRTKQIPWRIRKQKGPKAIAPDPEPVDYCPDIPDTLTRHLASRFGIKNDGRTDNTASIQRALDYIAAQGGGVLVFNVGRYRSAPLQLRAGVHIELKEGAILVPITHEGEFLHPDPAGDIILCGQGFIED